MYDALPFFPDSFDRLDAGFFVRTPRLISLDFDGTLAETQITPGRVSMPDETRKLLNALTMLPETKLMILSGRGVADLKSKVRVPGILYIGNHGLDFSPPAIGWGIPALSSWTRQTGEVRERLEFLVRRWSGTFLEVKGPSLTLHYRGIAPSRSQSLIPEVLEAVRPYPVLARAGKCALEIQPKDAPGKGEAFRRVAEKIFGEKKEGACLHIGDDPGDEDVFRVLQEMGPSAMGLKVGSEPTLADFRLSGPEETRLFLRLFMKD